MQASSHFALTFVQAQHADQNNDHDEGIPSAAARKLKGDATAVTLQGSKLIPGTDFAGNQVTYQKRTVVT